MKCGQFYRTVEHYIGGAFAKYGRFVSRHPWKFIIITIIVNGALGVGMLRTESNIEVGDVYLPLGTRAREEKERIESIFPDMSDSKYQKLQDTELRYSALFYVKSKTGNLLNRTVLEEIKALSELIQNITARDSDGKTVTLPDVCAKVNSACVVDGDIFWDPDFLSAVDTNTVTYPLFTSSASGTQNYALNIGRKVHLDNTGKYLAKVEYLKIEFFVQAVHKQEAIIWGEEFLTTCESFSSDNIELAYSHLDSLSQEIDKNVMSDTTLIVATFAIMITYACVATFSSRVTDQVGQRMWIGFGGILAAGLSIVASLGLCAAAGVSFVSIVGLMPFLIIGIGIDDMFIMLSGLSEAQTKMSVEDKLAETMRISGVGITITSLTDLIAFLVGAFSNFIAVQNFCIYTGVAVAFCYLNNVTLFAACLVIHERRVADNRHFATCRRIKTKEELKAEGSHSRCHVICCSGRPPLNRNEAESLLDKFPRWIVPKIVLNLPCKIIIIFLFLGYLAGAIYGCVYLKQGLIFSQLVTDDSYFYKFSEWEDDFFSNQVPVTYVIPKTLDYSDSAVQSEIYKLISDVQSSSYFDDDFEVNWLRSYTNSPFYASSNETEFIAGLLAFFDHPQYARFENDVVIDTGNNKITASRFYLLSILMENNTVSGELMTESRDIADKSSLDCFPFCFMYIVFEQYVRILGQTLQSVGIALVAVFIVTCLFMPHPLLVLFCTVAVTMIMAGVFGYIYYLDVALSAITMIHVIMSIGFSVDFTAHICHGYILSNGKTRAQRVNAAIDKTGAPIFHGAVSSLLGILVIVAAKSYIFKTFAVVMSFVLLFGIAHSLLLLPVVLSWIGPGRMTSHDKKRKPKSEIRSISKGHYSNGDISEHSHSNLAFEEKTHRFHYQHPHVSPYSNNVPLSYSNFNKNAKSYHMRQDRGLDDQWIWTEVK